MNDAPFGSRVGGGGDKFPVSVENETFLVPILEYCHTEGIFRGGREKSNVRNPVYHNQ